MRFKDGEVVYIKGFNEYAVIIKRLDYGPITQYTLKTKNDITYCILEEMLEHINTDLPDQQKLTKYKRVFEILKYNLEITKTNNICNQPIIEVNCNMFVTKEQCELLEELMKGEE